MKLMVTQVKSTINRKEDQKRTIAALGLGKIGRSRLHDDNPVIRGMINKVVHLVSVEEVEVKAPAKKTVKKATAPKKVAPVKEDTIEEKKPATKKAAAKKETAAKSKPATEKAPEAEKK